MQLYVPMSVSTLRLLWLVQIDKGVFSLQWPLQLARDARVDLVLAVGAERVSLGASVHACTPAGGGYHVKLQLDPLADPARAAIERALSAASASGAGDRPGAPGRSLPDENRSGSSR